MRTILYLHGSKESNYETGQKLGLTGEPLNYFMYALYEVKFEVEVNPDGSCEIIAVDGRKLEPKQ